MPVNLRCIARAIVARARIGGGFANAAGMIGKVLSWLALLPVTALFAAPSADFEALRARVLALVHQALDAGVALVAGVLGFGGIAVASAGIAKILFLVFLVLFVVSLVGGMMRRRAP